MVSDQDQHNLAKATELILDVIARHRGEDLRAVTVVNAAIQDIRVGERYLDATAAAQALLSGAAG